jgi:hypothetical protein
VCQIINIGTEPHVMLVLSPPGWLTMDQVMTPLQLPEGATPPAGLPNGHELIVV